MGITKPSFTKRKIPQTVALEKLWAYGELPIQYSNGHGSTQLECQGAFGTDPVQGPFWRQNSGSSSRFEKEPELESKHTNKKHMLTCFPVQLAERTHMCLGLIDLSLFWRFPRFIFRCDR